MTELTIHSDGSSGLFLRFSQEDPNAYFHARDYKFSSPYYEPTKECPNKSSTSIPIADLNFAKKKKKSRMFRLLCLSPLQKCLCHNAFLLPSHLRYGLPAKTQHRSSCEQAKESLVATSPQMKATVLSCRRIRACGASSKRPIGDSVHRTSVTEGEFLFAPAAREGRDEAAAHHRQTSRMAGCALL